MKEKIQHSKAVRNFEQGNYSRADFREVQHLFQKDDQEEQLKALLAEHWKDIPEGHTQNHGVKQIINQLYRQLFQRKPSGLRLWVNYYQRVAAVLLIPLLLFSVYWFALKPADSDLAMATIYSPPGARTSFILPDGSTGWLNADSKLTYPVQFETIREVKLSGEAFFHVKHQRAQKFVVRTSELAVQVLGTKFNVSAYQQNENIDVVLEEGSVQILDQADAESYLMKPNEKFSYNLQQNKAIVKTVDAGEYIAWTEGVLSFKGESLETVMNKLARWYNVQIDIRDEQLKSYNFKATFKNEPLEEILRMIALTTPMKYEIQERKPNSNGIYDKKTIVIDKK